MKKENICKIGMYINCFCFGWLLAKAIEHWFTLVFVVIGTMLMYIGRTQGE